MEDFIAWLLMAFMHLSLFLLLLVIAITVAF